MSERSDSSWQPGMDPRHSSRTQSGKPRVLSRLLAWHVSHDREINTLQQAEAQRRLQTMGRERMPFGQRLREVRLALGWTQSMAAEQLLISARTVIRYEKGQHRRAGVWLPLLLKLRNLESAYAGEIVAYLARVEREHPGSPARRAGQMGRAITDIAENQTARQSVTFHVSTGTFFLA